jgi:hypothetical protein
VHKDNIVVPPRGIDEDGFEVPVFSSVRSDDYEEKEDAEDQYRIEPAHYH